MFRANNEFANTSLKWAYIKYQQQDFNSAIQYANDMLTREPDNFSALYLRADAKVKIRATGAQEEYQKIMQLFMDRNQAEISHERYAQAIENANQILQINVNNYQAYFIRAKAKMGLKDLAGFIQDAKKCFELNCPKEIEEDLKRNNSLVFSNDEVVKIPLKWAHVKFNQKDFNSAIQYANDILTREPDNFSALYLRADAKVKIRAMGAQQEYKKVMQLFMDRNQVELSQGRYAQAIENANQILQINADNSQAYFIRAKAKMGLKDFEGFKQDAKKCCELNCTKEMEVELTRCDRELQNLFLGAEEVLQPAIPQDAPVIGHDDAQPEAIAAMETDSPIPSNSEISVQRMDEASVLLERNQLSAAFAVITEALMRAQEAAIVSPAFNPLLALAYHLRGSIYLKNGNILDARIDFNTAILVDSTCSVAKESLQRLSQNHGIDWDEVPLGFLSMMGMFSSPHPVTRPQNVIAPVAETQMRSV